MAYRLGRYLEVESIAVGKALDDLKTMVRLDAALEQPEAVVEPHGVDSRRDGEEKSMSGALYSSCGASVARGRAGREGGAGRGISRQTKAQGPE